MGAEGGTSRVETEERKPTLREHGGLKEVSYGFYRLRKGQDHRISQRWVLTTDSDWDGIGSQQEDGLPASLKTVIFQGFLPLCDVFPLITSSVGGPVSRSGVYSSLKILCVCMCEREWGGAGFGGWAYWAYACCGVLVEVRGQTSPCLRLVSW